MQFCKVLIESKDPICPMKKTSVSPFATSIPVLRVLTDFLFGVLISESSAGENNIQIHGGNGGNPLQSVRQFGFSIPYWPSRLVRQSQMEILQNFRERQVEFKISKAGVLRQRSGLTGILIVKLEIHRTLWRPRQWKSTHWIPMQTAEPFENGM